MISTHVSTTGKLANTIKKHLAEHGIKAWLCTQDISGGNHYRRGIAAAVKGCQIFLPLLNNEWCNSMECEVEFNMAFNLFTHSHETGRTKKGEQRTPFFVPVALPGLDWNADQILLLGSSINFIVKSEEMEEKAFLNQLLSEIVKSGLVKSKPKKPAISIQPSLPSPPSVYGSSPQVVYGSSAPSSPPSSPGTGKRLKDYTTEEICRMISDMGLSDASFRENAVNGELMLTLTDEDFTGQLNFKPMQIRRIRLEMQKIPQ